jgi:uncharacterized protein YdhG (YjbR/CyaY superfamily)/predicted enzyme related to lactoylglutathione lyase
MIRIGSIVLRVDDLRRQRAFWTAALDYLPREGDTDDFALLRPRNGAGPNLSLDRVHSTVQIPPRIHLDLYAEDQTAEVARLKSLGATEVHWTKRPPDADYVILADPEGNRFCVIRSAVDDYLAAAPKDKQATLTKLRQTIKAAAPKASESLSYGIVGYRFERKPVIYFGYWKAHYSLYGMGNRVTKAHAVELKDYPLSKGTIQFPADKPLPYGLVTKLVKARVAEIEKGSLAR